MPKRMSLCAVLASALVVVWSAATQAQSYPAKPIKLILPYSPGGIIDYVGRQMAQHLGDSIGQPVVAENRPGAGGITGTDAVARSAADGYTLVLMDPAIVINPTLQPSMPYDLFRQLADRLDHQLLAGSRGGGAAAAGQDHGRS